MTGIGKHHFGNELETKPLAVICSRITARSRMHTCTSDELCPVSHPSYRNFADFVTKDESGNALLVPWLSPRCSADSSTRRCKSTKKWRIKQDFKEKLQEKPFCWMRKGFIKETRIHADALSICLIPLIYVIGNDLLNIDDDLLVKRAFLQRLRRLSCNVRLHSPPLPLGA